MIGPEDGGGDDGLELPPPIPFASSPSSRLNRESIFPDPGDGDDGGKYGAGEGEEKDGGAKG